ncbi:MAG: metal-dependent transcriptional regulator [Candidatus Thermoplasmatota archaeon]
MPQKDVEEYLEAVLDLGGGEGPAKTSVVAKRLGVAPASVTEVFKRLDRDGLVSYEPYKGVQLTEKGLRAARKLKRRHRLLEVLLDKVLGMKGKGIHEEACRMEHALSDESERAICRTLGGPRVCPHGMPIPPCDDEVDCEQCIEEERTHESKKAPDAPQVSREGYPSTESISHEEGNAPDAPQVSREGCPSRGSISQEEEKAPDAPQGSVVPLIQLKPEQKGRIAHLEGGHAVMRRLCDLGLTPGTIVTVVRAAPFKGPVEISVRGCALVLGRGIAARIYVERRVERDADLPQP